MFLRLLLFVFALQCSAGSEDESGGTFGGNGPPDYDEYEKPPLNDQQLQQHLTSSTPPGSSSTFTPTKSHHNHHNHVPQYETYPSGEPDIGLAPSTTLMDQLPNVSEPQQLRLNWVTDSMMEIAWNEPEKYKEYVEGYIVSYMSGDKKPELVKIERPSELRRALTGLDAYTVYRVWIQAFTMQDSGIPSNVLEVTTDVRGPGPPRILNVSCLNETELYVRWQKPKEFYRTVDFYYVGYREEQWRDFREIVVEGHQTDAFIRNLTTNLLYEIRLRGGTRSIHPEYEGWDKVHKGNFSEPKHVLLNSECKPYVTTSPPLPRSAEALGYTIFILIACASLTVVLLVVALIIWRRCLHAEYYYLEDAPRNGQQYKGGWLGDGNDISIPLTIQNFAQHTQQLHADGDIGFSKEYEAIQAVHLQQDFLAEHSHHPDNRHKNRYLNIVAYDHTRVRLQPLPGQKKKCEYVNANYIDGFQKANAYIGTQGPLPTTFETFWRMVWEHQVHIIVMITNLVERGRKKCDMYWPDDGVQTYGLLQVKLLKEKKMATYTLRTLSLRHLKVKRRQSSTERIIYHYHYTNWPDHGTPSHPLPVLSFIKKSSNANPANAGPIIVHCSAGVGRTGTYIVLDAMLKQMQSRGEMNIFSFLNHIRAQRNFLVQTEEQYIFIHDALVEAINSGETTVPVSRITQYIQTLESGNFEEDSGQVISLAQRQFNLVREFVPKKYQTSAAAKACNTEKNRNPELICLDSSRVMLVPKPGVEGSDYINASFFPGFTALQEFVVTQHPLQSTKAEFWQMLWDHNIQMVVLLSTIDDQEFETFWPLVGETLDVGNGCHAKLLQESDRETMVLRDFLIQSVSDDYEMTVKVIQSSGWPLICENLNVDAFDLVRLVQESLEEGYDSPIAVVDKFGGLEAATFCALTTHWKQVASESQVDVYMFAKLFHEQRPSVWTSIDDYLLLYKCVETLSSHSFTIESEIPSSTSASNRIGIVNDSEALQSLTTSLTQHNSESTAKDTSDVEDAEDNEDTEEDESSESEEESSSSEENGVSVDESTASKADNLTLSIAANCSSTQSKSPVASDTDV